jgi:hypothetical protein
MLLRIGVYRESGNGANRLTGNAASELSNRNGGLGVMARGPAAFKQRDVTRALRATIAAGLGVQRIEIEKDGKIVVFPGVPKSETSGGTTTEWANI